MPIEETPRWVEIVREKTVFDVVTEIANNPQQEDPFFVVDLAQIAHRHNLWKTKMDRIQPCFPVRYNNNIPTLTVLGALGVSFACASKVEMDVVLRAGISPSRICYANQCKATSSVKFAAQIGVGWMFFDSKSELEKIKALHPTAKLILPIEFGHCSESRGAVKCGYVLPQDVPVLLQAARDLELEVSGISFYVERGEDFQEFASAIATARHVFSLAESLGHHFSILDIGTGFPSNPDSPEVNFDEMAAVINAALDDHFPISSGVKIIAEPGRFLVSSSFTLCTNIIAKKELCVSDENGTGRKEYHYYMNDGVFGSFSDAIYYSSPFFPILIKNTSADELYKSTIWGPTCDSTDRVMETCYLPFLAVGDWLMFENMGSYSLTRNTSFNGFSGPAIKYIFSSSALNYLQSISLWEDLMKALNISSDHD